jgi:predicted dehydrogenase
METPSGQSQPSGEGMPFAGPTVQECNMPEQIRWGLLSTARINDALIGPIGDAARSELAAVASRDLDKARAYAAGKGIPTAYGSYEALLADPTLDAVYISLPNALHCEWAVKAAEAGKHILCEKPLAVTLEQFEQMAEAAARNGVILFEAFMYLHHPQTRRALEIIGSGELGDLQTVQSWFHFYLPPENAQNIRLNAGLSGGSLWDVGVYPNSLAITMLGSGGRSSGPEAVWASQIIGESGVDVALRGELHFSAGRVAQVSCGFRTPFREGAFVVGDRAMLHIPEPWKPGLTGRDSVMLLTGRDGSQQTIVTPATDPYLYEVQAMEACILDGAAPLVSLADSRAFLQSALALYESARTGDVVRLSG